MELTSPLGLSHVYSTFQQQLRSCSRGKGHEAGDLNRLLELYRGWHRRLFPELPFEVFCEKLEQLGSTRPVQSCLRAMRGKEVHGERFGEDVDALLEREEEETAGFGDAAARANAGGFGAAVVVGTVTITFALLIPRACRSSLRRDSTCSSSSRALDCTSTSSASTSPAVAGLSAVSRLVWPFTTSARWSNPSLSTYVSIAVMSVTDSYTPLIRVVQGSFVQSSLGGVGLSVSPCHESRRRVARSNAFRLSPR